MDLFERIILLKQSTVFSSVRTDDLRVLAPVLQAQTYVAGDSVFHRGEVGEYMYLIESGVIGIHLTEPGREAVEIGRLERGECFGEMGLLDELPRSATAKVIEDATLLALDKERLRALIANHPELALGMLKSLSLKIRSVDEKLIE
jgi:CRP/FNR family transcriptional regulator/CRP/FNR family cyclic AMP-dependent transcriptional regulator